MRIAVYTDYAYVRADGGIYAERAFALFLSALAERVDRLVLVGRMRNSGGDARYRLPQSVEFVPLPHYDSLARPLAAGAAMMRSLREFWSALDGVDGCWLLGPHPLAVACVPLARMRRRRVVLGVRQDLVAYARSRHPTRRWIWLVARALDACYRGLGRRYRVVTVGPDLAERYARSPRLLEIAVSLVSTEQVVAGGALERDYEGELRVLSVGRVEEEKNPLLLADVLRELRGDRERDWRLMICGEGPLEDALRDRLERFGVSSSADLLGYVSHASIGELYEQAHVLLHVSWTEGFPQVLLEAFAAGLPVVATDVGGIASAAGHATRLIPAGDAAAAAAAIREVVVDGELRERLSSAGTEFAAEHTIEIEVQRLAEFLRAGPTRTASA